LALVLAGVAWTGACGTDAVGVETCRQIEEARCRRAPSCPNTTIDLTVPKHSDNDVDACIRYYRDACLHGLQTTADPGADKTKACIDAINRDCAIVEHPENDPACQWLTPPQPPPAPDASDAPSDAPDAAAVDAPSDAFPDIDALLGGL
jgi:hypothetical protein